MGSHYYTWGGQLVEDSDLRQAKRDGLLPSVTTVLAIADKPGIRKWREDVGPEEADRIAEESAAEGRRFHHLLESIVLTRGAGVAGLNADDTAVLMPTLEWVAETLDPTVMPVCEERRVHEAGFAGTVDMQGVQQGGRRCIIDFKTQRGKLTRGKPQLRTYFDDMAIQLAAYDAMVTERATAVMKDGGFTDLQWHSVIINRDPEHPAVKIKTWTAREQERAMAAWWGYLTAWQAIKDYRPQREAA